MSDHFLIGVDIGTQGTKAALFAGDGRTLATAFERSRLLRPAPGVVEEDPERQAASVCRTVRACVASAGIDPAAVAGLAIDGQMAGIIGIGRDGRAVTPYDSWLDTRCGPLIAEMRRRAGDEIIRKTGGPASFNHGPKVLWWKKTRPRVYRSIRAFVQPGAYAAMRLCGLGAAEAFIDWTYLHFSGFADTRRGRWDEDLMRAFGVAAERLPRIVAPHAVVGAVTASMGRRCGLRAGTPVVAGCGDTAASFLACGATRPGVCVDVAGTASVFATTTDRFRPDLRHRVLGCGRSATPGLWHPYAYINGGGMNLEWFARHFGGGLTFDALNAAAASASGAPEGAPMFVPHLGGRVSPAWPMLRGAWAGLTWDHRPAHLYRAVLEGVALEYGLYQRVVRSLYPRFQFRELRITGGGEKSGVWNALKADVLQTPVVRIARSEGAPMGAALLAGFGVGLFDDLRTAAEAWVKTGAVQAPNRRRAALCRRRVDRYAALLGHLKAWSEPNA